MEEQFSSLTLTKLAKVKVDPHAKIKVKGQMVQTGDRLSLIHISEPTRPY